jgi:hypothetical protein
VIYKRKKNKKILTQTIEFQIDFFIFVRHWPIWPIVCLGVNILKERLLSRSFSLGTLKSHVINLFPIIKSLARYISKTRFIGAHNYLT